MYKLMPIEKGLVISFTLLLFSLNLICIYFFIELLNYDEIIRYIENDIIKEFSPRKLAFFFFITAMLNLFFISVYLMYIMLNQNKKYDKYRSKQQWKVSENFCTKRAFRNNFVWWYYTSCISLHNLHNIRFCRYLYKQYTQNILDFWFFTDS